MIYTQLTQKFWIIFQLIIKAILAILFTPGAVSSQTLCSAEIDGKFAIGSETFQNPGIQVSHLNGGCTGKLLALVYFLMVEWIKSTFHWPSTFFSPAVSSHLNLTGVVSFMTKLPSSK